MAFHDPWLDYYNDSRAMLDRALELAPTSADVRAANAQLSHVAINDSGANYPGGLFHAFVDCLST